MTINSARRFLIISSLVIIGLQLTFLFVAPILGFPLESPDNLDIAQAMTPVFFGYLGAATYFVFGAPGTANNVRRDFLGLITVGPIVIYVLVVSSIFFAFGWSNRASVQPGGGMSVDGLNNALMICLTFLATTTSVTSSFLFGTQARASSLPKESPAEPPATKHPR